MSRIEQVKELHNQGEYQQAIDGYNEILEKDPNNDEAHFGKAHASSRLNQLEIALAHIKEAVKLVPNSDRYQQFLGQMYLANQQVDDALKAFKRSLKENPNLFFSYLAIGDIYALKNEFGKAKENYKLALKLESSGIPAIIKLAKLHIMEGNYPAADEELNTAELQFPNDPSIKIQMGILKLEQQQEGYAELYFKKILEDEPNHEKAKSLLAISLMNSDFDKASTLISEQINRKVQLPELMVALGMLYAKNKQHSEAIKYLAPISVPGLAYPSWILKLAEVYLANQQPNAAKAVLDELLKKGENPKALLLLGQIHLMNDDTPEAIKSFKRIKTSDQEYSIAQLRQAECLYKAEDFQGAITQVDKLLSKQPDHNAAIKLKLNALSQLNQIDDALALIGGVDSSKQVDDFNQLMHFYRGMFFDAQQKYDQAWKHFNELDHPKPHPINLLSSEEEKMVQSFASQPAGTEFRFVFTDPATGHHDFLQWLLQNNITPLVDRFNAKGRADVFSQQWTVPLLNMVDETQAHLWRKKYSKQLKHALAAGTELVADFIPFSPINVAVIKKVFPQAQVLVLSRNFADLRLHNRVFGTFQLHYSQLSKLINQMITLNSNLKVVDIDAWQNKESQSVKNIHDIFGPQVSEFELAGGSPLDRVIFPYMHWKNYQQQLNQ